MMCHACRSELLGLAKIVYARTDKGTPSKVVAALDKERANDPVPKFCKAQLQASTKAAGRACPARGNRKPKNQAGPQSEV